jgi:hypothetical protein
MKKSFFILRISKTNPTLQLLSQTKYKSAIMAEPAGLTDIEVQEIDSNWDEVFSFLPCPVLKPTGRRQF